MKQACCVVVNSFRAIIFLRILEFYCYLWYLNKLIYLNDANMNVIFGFCFAVFLLCFFLFCFERWRLNEQIL